LRFQRFDCNGNGVLEFPELLEMIADLCPFLGIETPEESKLKAAFDTADENHDGVLSKSEFPPFLRTFLKEAVPAGERLEVEEVERLETMRRTASEEAARAEDQLNKIIQAEVQKLVDSHNGKLVLAEFELQRGKEVEEHTVVSASQEGALAFAKVATAERQNANPGMRGPCNLRYREVDVKAGRCRSADDTEMVQQFLAMEYRKGVSLH